MRENRLRPAEDRQGLRLTKSRSRVVNAMDCGLYALTDVQTNGLVHPAQTGRWTHSLTLDDVEDWLK